MAEGQQTLPPKTQPMWERVTLIHPSLFLLASVFFLYSQAGVVAAPGQIFRPMLVLSLLLLLLAILIYRLSRHRERTAILLTIIVFGLLFPAQLFKAAGAVLVIMLVSLSAIARLRKRRLTFYHVNVTFALTSFILAVSSLFAIARPLVSVPYYPNPADLPSDDLRASTPLPDIYYILLDGYGRADVLQELYQFDNTDFILALEERGFVVPAEARTNYPRTSLAIAATLNMDYIQNLVPGSEKQPFWWLIAPLLDHSRVRRDLSALGYRSVAIATNWSITDNPTADIYFSPRPVELNDYESFYLAKTPLSVLTPFLSNFALVPSFDSHRELIQYNLDTLAELPSIPGPKFVFAHIISNHPPFVFDADGKPIQPSYPFTLADANDLPLDKATYQQGYIEQTKFMNRRVLEMVDAILQQSLTPPIVILQADHGPGMLSDFLSLESTCLKERFAIFAAYHLPGQLSHPVPDDITPVNLFRFVFNEYFQTNLPYLENAFYFPQDAVHIYDLKDVSLWINTCNAR